MAEQDTRRAGWIAVIDVGSNSLRFVVYHKLTRTPLQMYSEKLMCGLGRTLMKNNRLDPDGKVQALAAMGRYARLAAGMNVAEMLCVGTSALRDAEDGPDFVAEVKARTGIAIQVIDGPEEARLSALGVVAGMPGAEGVIGDIGGGSLELVAVEAGQPGARLTLPLGTFRLMGDESVKDKLARIDRHLDGVAWLPGWAGRDFIAVGGAWRAMATMHMQRMKYPLPVVQNFVWPVDTVVSLCDELSKQSPAAIAKGGGITPKRAEVLPAAALVLARVLDRMRPGRVLVSSQGLREGMMFDRLPPDLQSRDPLIDGCHEVARRMGRAEDAAILSAWLAPIAAECGPGIRRLAEAASSLSYLNMTDHPDNRARNAVGRVMLMPLSGIDHPGRVQIALMLAVAMGANPEADWLKDPLTLLAPGQVEDARRIGEGLRLAHVLTGGAMALLAEMPLLVTADTLALSAPDGWQALVSDGVSKRLESLATLMKRRVG